MKSQIWKVKIMELEVVGIPSFSKPPFISKAPSTLLFSPVILNNILKLYPVYLHLEYTNIGMKKYHLGEFEELVVLAIGILHNKAYSVTIKDEIEQRTTRTVSLGALHTALKRMEDKGYLRSFPGESNDERGGRPKRYFEITALGKKAVQHSRDTRAEFWNAVPKTILQSVLALR
jgi:DNA-binding PadR family transcriptional regulator